MVKLVLEKGGGNTSVVNEAVRRFELHCLTTNINVYGKHTHTQISDGSEGSWLG